MSHSLQRIYVLYELYEYFWCVTTGRRGPTRVDTHIIPLVRIGVSQAGGGGVSPAGGENGKYKKPFG
jgi:hypothetical protein